MINKANRTVYKLVKVEMNELCRGDLFCLDDEGAGHECMEHIYFCTTDPTLYDGVVGIEVEIANASSKKKNK